MGVGGDKLHLQYKKHFIALLRVPSVPRRPPISSGNAARTAPSSSWWTGPGRPLRGRRLADAGPGKSHSCTFRGPPNLPYAPPCPFLLWGEEDERAQDPPFIRLGERGGLGTQARDDHRYSVCSAHVLNKGAAPPETAARPRVWAGAPGSPGVGNAVRPTVSGRRTQDTPW